MELESILARGLALEASDVHLKIGRPPMFRAHGRLFPMEGAESLPEPAMQAIVDQLLDDYHRKQFRERFQADLAYQSPANGRYRVNVFRQRGDISIALRVIPPQV